VIACELFASHGDGPPRCGAVRCGDERFLIDVETAQLQPF
jgi:hypothetical protein